MLGGTLTSLLEGLSGAGSGSSKGSKKSARADPALSAACVQSTVPLQAVAVPTLGKAQADADAARAKAAARKQKRALKRKVEHAVARELAEDGDDGSGEAPAGAPHSSHESSAAAGDGPAKKKVAVASSPAATKPKAGKVARVMSAEELERLERTVFVGNVVASLTRRQLQRAMNRFVNGGRQSLDELIMPPKRMGEGRGDEEAEEEEEGDGADAVVEDTGDFGGIDSAFAPGRDLRSPVESVRLRSLPIQGVSVESGSDFRKMRKVRVRVCVAVDLSSGVPDPPTSAP